MTSFSTEEKLFPISASLWISEKEEGGMLAFLWDFSQETERKKKARDVHKVVLLVAQPATSTEHHFQAAPCAYILQR